MNKGFNDIRKRAEKLEEEISSKIIFFSKACSGRKHSFSGSSVNEPLLSPDNVIESTSLEIESLLAKLNDIVEELSGFEFSPKSDTVSMFTINQHRELFCDYSFEYKKNLENYKIRRDREKLLNNAQLDIDLHGGRPSSSFNRRTDMYLKEHEHIRSSDRLIDDQISIAVETREHLLSQRNTMKKFQTRMHDLGHRFPIVNSLVQRINLRKRRDSIIVGGVVFFCVLFLLFYSFH